MSKSFNHNNLNKTEYDFCCLLEREDALSKAQSFFNMLTAKKRGILRVVGDHGSGRTCFLDELAQLINKSNYALGLVNAEEKARVLNKEYLAIDADIDDIQDFERNILKRLAKSKKTGLIILIDNAMTMNNKTLNYISELITSEIDVNIGLVYSIEPDNIFPMDYINVDFCETVYINALSPKGVKTWIQNILSWDSIPNSFLKWIYIETKGLPKLLKENINCLLQNGLLKYNSNNNWTVAGECLEETNKDDKVNKSDSDKPEVFNTGNFERELKMSKGIEQFWNTWEYWSEATARIKDILAKHEALQNLEHVRLYMWFGRLTNLEGDQEQVIAILNSGLELFRKIKDKAGEAEILYMKALALSVQGSLTKVSLLLEESLSVYRVIDYKLGIARVLQYLALIHYYQGDYDKAELYSVESLEICRSIKDKGGISRALVRLGMIARGKGNFGQAMNLFNEQLQICEEIDDKEGISNALINIAEMSRSQQNYGFARDYYERCLKLVREMGYKSLIARTLKDLGEIARYEGDFDKAAELFQESIDILEESKDNSEMMWLYRSMAELEMQKQSYALAKELYLKGLRLFRESKQITLIYALLVFEGLAEIAFAQDELIQAARLLGAADRLYEVTGKLIARNDFAQFHMRHLKIQDKMNKEVYEAAWSEGNVMSLETALDYSMEEKGDKMDGNMAEKMINYIKSNYSNDISLTDISEHFNMSPCYLSTMFKFYTGENFRDYLNYYRVEKAKEYLKNGKTKIGLVAKMVGCNSINTFIRIFKKYEGMSPGKYIGKN